MKRFVIKCLSFVKRVLMRIIAVLQNWYYESKVKHAVYDVKEIFMQQNTHAGYNRLDTVVRYLSIENYYNKNDFGFDLYEKMQSKRMGKDYATKSKGQYKELIASWEKKGYDTDSEILLDSNLKIIDGSHRMALALYHNISEISCKVYGKRTQTEYGIEWFIRNDFSVDEMKKIIEKEKELEGKCRSEISVILWPPVMPYFEEIIEKISMEHEITKKRFFEYSEKEFEEMVYKVYSIDDIEEWKIEKKLSYMQQYEEKKIAVFGVNFECPDFRYKKLNLHSLSKTGERLKKIIRECYKDKLDNYFYDIIVHTGDNYVQSRELFRLFDMEEEK